MAHRFSDANTCKELIEQFKQDLTIFGDVEFYERKPQRTPLLYFPKVITDVLSHIFGIRFSYPNCIPKSIFSSSNGCKYAFLQALFDDEGTMSSQLSICMSSFNLLSELKILLDEMRIETGNLVTKRDKCDRVTYSFCIKKKSFENFKEKIDFIHPLKSENLILSIQTMKRPQRTRDPEELKSDILDVLNDGALKTLDIAHSVQLSLPHTSRFLNHLKKQGLIQKSGFKNKYYWNIV